MMNVSIDCHFEDQLYYRIISFSLTCLAVPIYSILLFVLFFKCPKNFKNFRNKIVFHVLSNILNEVLTTIIWLPKFYFPTWIICSVGPMQKIPILIFQFHILSLYLIGISLIRLFAHHLENTSIGHNGKMEKFCKYLTRLVYLSIIFHCVNTVILYEQFLKQDDYKLALYNASPQTTQSVIFCDNCFVIKYDNLHMYITFYAGGAIAFLFGFTILTMLVTTVIRLRTKNRNIPSHSSELKRHYFHGLVVQLSVHLIFMALPFYSFFVTYLFNIHTVPQYIYDAIFIASAQHGSAASLTIILTNTLLFTAIKDIFKTMFCFKNQTKEEVQGNADNTGD